MALKKHLRIVMAATECVPFAKTGGLADVVGALPRELAGLGHDVSVILPCYRSVGQSCKNPETTGIRLDVPLGNELVAGDVVRHVDEFGVAFYFIKNRAYYNRKNLYGTAKGDYEDNAERFIFFSRAVIGLINAVGEDVDILHCHDWQTGIIPALLRYGDGNTPALGNARTVFTIHNLAYQGKFRYYDLKMTGLPEECFTPEGLEFYGQMNLMKSGIVYSDAVTTVSRKYSREIQTRELGCGLEGVLANRDGSLYGILNGVDYGVWSPEGDALIAANYSAEDLSGKKKCRKDLLKTFKLNIPDKVPIIGVISRLAAQKGFDLISAQIENILETGAAFVLLGSGDRKYEELFRKIGRKHRRQTGIRIAFSEELAHKIEAGSDMFLMPSRYEPCGLNQMYSLRYGTIPIVRATGGLDDTIKNYDRQTGRGNGFKFSAYKPRPLIRTIKRAVELFADHKHWGRVVRNAMSEDFSWKASAKKYVKMYREVLKK